MVRTQAEAVVMAQAAVRFDEVNAGLQSMLGTLMAELGALNGAWKGLGATAFEQVKSQYAADLRNLGNALGETAEAIRSSGAGYQTSDAEAASRVGRSGGTLSLPL